MDTLRAPKRDRSSGREDEAKGDGAALALIVALALCVLGAIFYVHRYPVGDGIGTASGIDTAQDGTAAGTGFVAGTPGERKAMVEAPLEKAKALPTERFAGPVAHVTESDACKSLRRARDRARENLRQRHSEWEAADLKRELDRVISQGTERGCWSGGTG